MYVYLGTLELHLHRARSIVRSKFDQSAIILRSRWYEIRAWRLSSPGAQYFFRSQVYVFLVGVGTSESSESSNKSSWVNCKYSKRVEGHGVSGPRCDTYCANSTYEIKL